ncbi:restriction endonuclease subunit S [Streptomyces albidoflavus]
MGELPEGWAWARLGDVAQWGSGGTPKAKASDYYGGTIPWAVIGDMSDGVLLETAQTITEAGLAESSAKWIPKGSILVAMYGSIGKLAIAGIPITSNQAIAHAVPFCEVLDVKYLFWYLRSQREKLVAAGKGGAQRNISQSILKQWPIPLPPLAEQHRIVEALEEQLSRLDAASVLLEQALLRGSALQKQLTSAVVGGRRRIAQEEGDVHKLLSMVDEQVARAAGKKRWAQARAPEALWVHQLPIGWRWRTLGSLCVDVRYGTSAKAARKERADDIPVIRMGNIQGGRLDLEDLKYLPAEHPDIEKTALRDGDLLFNRTNSAELVGKSAVYREAMGAAVYASYLIRCRFADGIEPEWVNTVVNSNFGRRYIASVVTQQAGQANVNSTKLALMPIPVPPQAEQCAALKILRDWEGALARPKLAARVAMKRSDGLRSAILRSAFSGMLALRDPAEEPATTLLARIAVERGAAKPASRAKRAASSRNAATTDKSAKAVAAPTSIPTNTVQQELFQ